MWGGRKARDPKPSRSRGSSSSSSDKYVEFEHEVYAHCTCEVSVYYGGGSVEVNIYDYSNNPYNVEHDKNAIRKLFNKYIGSGKLSITVY